MAENTTKVKEKLTREIRSRLTILYDNCVRELVDLPWPYSLQGVTFNNTWDPDSNDWNFITDDELNECQGDCCDKQEKTKDCDKDCQCPKKTINNDGRDTCFKCGAPTVKKTGFHMEEYDICPKCGI